jgi:hypothetical protein
VHEVPEVGEGPAEARGAWQLLETQEFQRILNNPKILRFIIFQVFCKGFAAKLCLCEL